MRYQNWDVLVFPDQCKIPQQEFKTNCQVIPDPEFHNPQINPQLLPTVTSFIPGLPTGTHFRISLHCWQNPEITQYARTLKKPDETVVFEVRLFMDGRLAGSKLFSQHGPWPSVIDLGVEIGKNGEFEKLKFPVFHRELLQQNYWNPGDDLGRIKVIIAEGFSRDHTVYPFERVKNIVSFSFQHAPLEVLEGSSIAWPNPTMWRQVSVAPYFVQQYSPQRQFNAVELHTHSPRQAPSDQPTFQTPTLGSTAPPNSGTFPRQPQYDPFMESQNSAFSHWRQRSLQDVSMSDYASNSHTRTNSSRQVSDPMPIDRRQESMSMTEAYDKLCEKLTPSAPVNTPQDVGQNPSFEAAIGPLSPETLAARMEATEHDITTTYTAQLISTVFHEAPIDVKQENDERTSPTTGEIHSSSSPCVRESRKKNIQDSPLFEDDTGSNTFTVYRRASHNSTVASNGTKRQRIITPASSKAIDDEDEPRTSPALRVLSRISSRHKATAEGMREDRKIMGDLTNA